MKIPQVRWMPGYDTKLDDCVDGPKERSFLELENCDERVRMIIRRTVYTEVNCLVLMPLCGDIEREIEL